MLALAIAAITLAVAAALVAFLLVSRSREADRAINEFLARYDRRGVLHLTFKAEPGTTDESWTNFKTGEYKSVEKKRGRIESLEVAKGEKLSVYDRYERNLTVTRRGPGEDPLPLAAIVAARKGRLERAASKGDRVDLKIRYSKEQLAQADGQVGTSGVGVDKYTGKLLTLIFQGDSDDPADYGSIEVIAEEWLPARQRKARVFNTKELSKKDVAGRGGAKRVNLGFERKDLLKFEQFKPYWLGPTVKGSPVQTILSDTEEDGSKSLFISYGREFADIWALPRESTKVQRTWHLLRGYSPTRVKGFRAKFDGSQVFVRTNDAIYRITGIGSDFPDLVKRQFQPAER